MVAMQGAAGPLCGLRAASHPDKPPAMTETSTERPWRNFYGRLKGKALHPRQMRDMDEVLPQVRLPGVTFAENPDRVALDRAGLFGDAPVWLEIGFGSGEHLVHQAQSNPGVRFIGCEPYVNGVASLLGKIRREKIGNVFVHTGDARDLFDVLPDGSIARAFLLYPDPWPKARHHRRRFVTAEHLVPLHRVLEDGAEFRVATDIPDYVRQTLEEVPPVGFERLSDGPEDWRTAWPDWVSTRYEQKALREGREPHYLTFRKD